MNLKTIINMMSYTSFWRMDKTSLNTNIFDEYDTNTLINNGCLLQQDGSTNVNLSTKSTNIIGGYIDSTDNSVSNNQLSNISLHISFNFKCDEEVVGIHPIISKWFPENQYFVGFENGNLVAKLQTDSTLHELYIDNKDVIYNGRWNHVSFVIYNGNVELHLNGHSQDDNGLTSMIISGTPIIGINSPFRIGGDASYAFTKDCYISDVALTSSIAYDVRPLYILTRDLEERYLDLAPDYYFNITEGMLRNSNGDIVNRGTKGSNIKGYLKGADISEFTIRNDSNFYPKKMVKIPQNGYFSIDDDIELNLSGNESATLIVNGSYSAINSNSTQNYLYPMIFGNDGDVWRYYQYFSSYNNDPRYRTDAYDGNGDILSTNQYISQINIALWDRIGQRTFKMGSQGTPTEDYKPAEYWGFSSSYNFPNANALYTPPTDQTFSQNSFWLNNLNEDYANACLSDLALWNRGLTDTESSELNYAEPLALLFMYTNKYFLSWKSCITDIYSTIRHYTNINNNIYHLDYIINYSTELQHSDPITNKVNNWTGAVYLNSTSNYMKSHSNVKFWGSNNFFQNIFIHNLNATSAYEFIQYTDNNQTTKHLTVSINQRNGVFSLGDIEVKFDRYYFGSFSTSSQKILNDGYHMISIMRNGVTWELWIDGELEEVYITPEVFNVTASYNMLKHSGGSCYIADALFCSDITKYKEFIEYLYQGFHTNISGTTYLNGTPIESALHTLNSETLSKLQTNVTDSNGNFNFNLSKTANSSGKYLMALPLDENATSNVVVHGPYQTAVTYDQITTEDTISEIADIIQDMNPYAYYPFDDDVRDPILDVALAGNSYNGVIDSGTDYQLEQTSVEPNSKAIHFGVTGNAKVTLPTNNVSLANGFTFSTWFKMVGTDTQPGLFEMRHTTANQYQLSFGFRSNELTVYIGGSNNTATQYNSTKTVQKNVWMFYTLRITPSPNPILEILENGVVVYSNTSFVYPPEYSRSVWNLTYYWNYNYGINAYIKDGKVSQNAFYDYPVSDEDLQKQAKRGYGYNATTLKSLILSDNPDVYYTFDRLKTIQDEMGNYDLTVNGTVDYDKNSVIINKDVVGNNYLYNDNYKIDPVTNDVTIEFNFKITGNHTQSTLLSEWNNETGDGVYKFQLEPAGVLKCYILDDFHYIETTVDINEYHLVQLTIINANNFNLYIDNVFEGSLTLTPLILADPYEDVVNALTPLAYYRLGELYMALDETGNFDGSFNGSPTLGETGLLYGNSNNAISFNTASYIESTIPELDPNNPFSLSFLFNRTSSQDSHIFNIPDTGTGSFVVIQVGGGFGGYGDIGFGSGVWGTHKVEFDDGQIQNGITYNIVISYNGTSFEFWKDGIQQTILVGGNFGSGEITESLLINSRATLANRGMDAIIDEVSIYNKVLTQTDVKSLYTSSVAPTYQDAVKDLNPYAYYRLGESSGIDVMDETGNFDGTYLNSPTLGETGLLSNNDNTAVTFNGVDQAIDTGIIYTASANRTWGCLIKSNNVSSGLHALFGDILSGNSDSRFTFGMNGGVWYLNIGDGAGGYYVSESVSHNLVIDTTYHIIMVQDGLDYKLYVDSVLVNTFVSTADASLNDGTDSVYIGRAGTFENWHFDGTIDEPFIIDQSLTQTEIDYLYNISKDNIVTPQYTPYKDVVNALTPIVYYRMNDQITIASDETGNYNGTYVNSPTLGTQGLLINDSNTSVNFDGVDQYVNCGNIPVNTGSKSFSFLINTTETGIKHTLSKWENETGGDDSYLFELRNNSIRFLISSDGSDSIEAQGTTVINDGQIHHIVGVFESTTKLAIYIDGVLDIENVTTIPTDIHNGNIDVWLSAFDSTPSDLFLAGTLDEVIIFDKVLTPTEITTLYNSSKNVGSGDGVPPFGLNRMTIASDSTGNPSGQLESVTWIDDIAFYSKELNEVRRTIHYDQFLLKKSTLINDL